MGTHLARDLNGYETILGWLDEGTYRRGNIFDEQGIQGIYVQLLDEKGDEIPRSVRESWTPNGELPGMHLADFSQERNPRSGMGTSLGERRSPVG